MVPEVLATRPVAAPGTARDRLHRVQRTAALPGRHPVGGEVGGVDPGAREPPPAAVEGLPTADAIVVLGGSMYATQRDDGSVHLYARYTGNRFETAIEAFRAGRAPIIVFAGGGTGIEGTPMEGERNRRRAIERGVPAEAALAAGQ
jgi:uncharacterized SAM-binding protein YcdF (DUF218 family)